MSNPQPGGASGTPADPAPQPSGQVPTPSTPPPTAPAGQASASDPNGNPSTSGMTLEQALDALGKVRAEAAKNRVDSKRLADLEAAMKAADDAKLSADQKRDRDFAQAQARAQELELRVQQQGLELAGHRLAAGIGIADAGAAIALVLAEHGAEVQYDEKTGVPTNLDALLKEVLKAHPILAAQGQGTGNQRQSAATSGGATNPGRQAGNGGLTLDIIKAMPMKERMARIAEITAWEKAQRETR